MKRGEDQSAEGSVRRGGHGDICLWHRDGGAGDPVWVAGDAPAIEDRSGAVHGNGPGWFLVPVSNGPLSADLPAGGNRRDRRDPEVPETNRSLRSKQTDVR